MSEDIDPHIRTCNLCGSDMRQIHFAYKDNYYNTCKCNTYITDNNQSFRNLACHVKLYGCPKCGMVIMSIENDD